VWVVDPSAGTNGEIYRFGPSELGASNASGPDATISSIALQGPIAIAFDASGNLWVADFGENEIFEFLSAVLPDRER
jgi:DNA-binding beta-propeller fold protein YncE